MNKLKGRSKIRKQVNRKRGTVKVTVQFETEGNSQNEIVSHMDRSEVKL